MKYEKLLDRMMKYISRVAPELEREKVIEISTYLLFMVATEQIDELEKRLKE